MTEIYWIIRQSQLSS